MIIKLRKSISSVIAISAFIAFTTVNAGFLADTDFKDKNDPTVKLISIFEIISKKYVKEYSNEEIINKVLKGALKELDPHSAFMDDKEYEEFVMSSTGEFTGVGMVVEKVENGVKVVSPIDDTPAFKAGIKAGDLIIKIDDVLIGDMSLQKSVNLMRGVPGTEVTLLIKRKTEIFSETIVRDVITINPVKKYLLDKNTGYIRISTFSESAYENFNEALEEFKESGIKALIIDLRDNPGGLLNSVIDITDALIGPELTIVSTKSRKREVIYKADKEAVIKDLDIIVLVDNGSASASEILAGALQDNKAAIIAGTKTYGKGSVQSLIPLINGEAIKLTTSLYYTPSGKSIQAKGIIPDVIFEDFKVVEKQDKKKGLEILESDLAGHIKNPDDQDEILSNEEIKIKAGDEKVELLNKDPYVIQAKGLLRALSLGR